MSRAGQPLVVGAGPVGLAAALFLARQGRPPRVVEMRVEPSLNSKALAVNPRTLEILAPTGVTRQMLELGTPIRGVRFHRRGSVVAAPSFAGIHPTYPFMLALSQATTERLLAQALRAAGVEVEHGVKMVGCEPADQGVEVALERSAGDPREVVRCPWLLAADGAHSVARHQLGIDFAGSSFANAWHLADAPLRTALAEDHAHVVFLEGGGFLFMLRVVDPALDDSAGPVWRVLGSRPEPLGQLVQAEPAGPPIWTSSFHVAHRIARTLTAGDVHLAGDAAHVHSPVGARGMNLGIEDAWVFAELVRTDRLSAYSGLRRPIDGSVVRRVELISRIASAETAFHRLVRAVAFPLAIRTPFVRTRMVTTVAGLDHALPDVDSDRPQVRAAA